MTTLRLTILVFAPLNQIKRRTGRYYKSRSFGEEEAEEAEEEEEDEIKTMGRRGKKISEEE